MKECSFVSAKYSFADMKEYSYVPEGVVLLVVFLAARTYARTRRYAAGT